MVGADQFVLNTILPSKFGKLQTGEARRVKQHLNLSLVVVEFEAPDYEQISAAVIGIIHVDPVPEFPGPFPEM